MDLMNMLTQNLGISDSQAEGGTGLLLDLAKKQLGGDDFSKIASVIPPAAIRLPLLAVSGCPNILSPMI